jgi:RNA polymerase sigma-70 factor (ECF subfamily)
MSRPTAKEFNVDDEVASTPFADRDSLDVERMAVGDAAAFGRIYDRYRDRVYGFAYRMLRSSAPAEDVTHEVFLALIVDPRRFSSDKGSLLTYLCGIARHHVLRYFRRAEYAADQPDHDRELDAGGADALDGLLEKERAEQVNASIDSLPPLQREVLILREFHELSYSEIAEVTTTDVNVVKARLHRARQAIAARLSLLHRLQHGGSLS